MLFRIKLELAKLESADAHFKDIPTSQLSVHKQISATCLFASRKPTELLIDAKLGSGRAIGEPGSIDFQTGEVATTSGTLREAAEAPFVELTVPVCQGGLGEIYNRLVVLGSRPELVRKPPYAQEMTYSGLDGS